jgi:suppressor of fused-like protein
VTYGFSELYAKESDDPEVSGWGFELTFRLTRKARDKRPPPWAINFLMNLGRYVRRSRNPFGASHCMDLNGPIAIGDPTHIRAITFTPDPELAPIDTSNGRVEFLQVLGLTLDEYHACGDWRPSAVVDVIREGNPLLVTDLRRASVLDGAEAAARVEAGIDREGSSSDRSFVSVVDWSASKKRGKGAASVTLGAKGVQDLIRKLRSRLLHRREFWLFGREKAVGLEPAKACGWRADGRSLHVRVTEAAVRAMRATLRAQRGTYTWDELPGVTLEVVPSEIRGPDGELIEVIG